MASDIRAIADANAQTIDTLFKSFYVIPDFQRPYVWTKKQVRELLDDIRAEHQDNGADGTHYFLGSVVVYSEEPATYSIVDGQQRLTTLFILFCALRDRIKQIDKHSDDVGFLQERIAGNSVARGGVTRTRTRIKAEYDRDRYVLDAISNGTTKKLQLKKKDAGRHLLDAYQVALGYLEEKFDEDVEDLRDYAYYLLTKVEIIKIETGDFLRALVIFERINDRGLGLSALDLLKNLLFKMSGSDEHSQIAARWHEVIEILRKGGEKNNMRFLRYFLCAHYDLEHDKVIKAADVFEWFMENKERIGLDKKTFAFVSKLKTSAEDYVNILQGRGPGGSDGRKVDGLEGIVWQKSAVRQHIPVLMAAKGLGASDYDRLAKAMEGLCLVFALSNAQWNELERVAPLWCRRLRGMKSEEVAEFIATDMRRLTADKIAKAHEQLEQTDKMRPSLLKFLLARMTQQVDRDCDKGKDLAHYLEHAVTIEHVLPQSLPIMVVQEGFQDLETARKHLHRLGNLTLLYRGPNSVASADVFAKKRRIYERSDFELTKSLVTDLEMGKKTKYGAASAAYGLKPFEAWDVSAVNTRHKQLQAIIKKAWNF